MSEKRLVRATESDRMLFGVASGISEYLNIDPTIVRVLFVIMTLMGGPGIIAYFILLLVMPEGSFSGGINTFEDDEVIIKGQ